MSAAPHSFASRLKKLREERGMSKTGLGRAVGVSTTCVWNWEEGNTEPRSQNFVALAQALKVPRDFLEFGSRTAPVEALVNPSVPSFPDAPIEEERDVEPLTIAEAKAGLALGLGVPEGAIEISVRY